VRRVVIAVLAAVVIAGAVAAGVWGADAGRNAPGIAVPSTGNFPVAHQVSCSSATSCLVVGSAANPATGTSVPVAQVLSGGAWRTVTVASPGPDGMSSALTGVSCPAVSYCLAVGEYNTTSFGDPVPYAMAWNGTSFTPVARFSLPAGAYMDALGGVSCPAANRCVVVALATGSGTPAGFGDGDLVWTWNRGRWAMKAVPSPDNTDMENFSSLQCSTLTYCVAAGQQDMDASGNTLPALDTWNGKSFTPINAPLTPGMTFGGFNGLSCVSRKHCVVVGSGYPVAGAPTTSFLDVWNGRRWNYTPWAGPAGSGNAALSGVSCVSARDCVAIGSDSLAGVLQTAVFAWDGSAWAAATAPDSGAGQVTLFNDVDCVKAVGCTAIGEQIAATTGMNSTPVAGQWNGASWQLTTR